MLSNSPSNTRHKAWMSIPVIYWLIDLLQLLASGISHVLKSGSPCFSHPSPWSTLFPLPSPFHVLPDHFCSFPTFSDVPKLCHTLLELKHGARSGPSLVEKCIHLVGGVAQWLGRRSLAGGHSLPCARIYGWHVTTSWVKCPPTNQANSAFHPSWVGTLAVIHVTAWITGWRPLYCRLGLHVAPWPQCSKSVCADTGCGVGWMLAPVCDTQCCCSLVRWLVALPIYIYETRDGTQVWP